MGRRSRGKGPRGGPGDRLRGRVRDRVQGGRSGRGAQGGGGRKRGPSFDVGEIEGYARRLAESGGGKSALAGAASGLAGGGFASRFLGGGAEGSDEEFRTEIIEQLSLMDERLRVLEEQMNELLGAGSEQDPVEPEDISDPESSPQ